MPGYFGTDGFRGEAGRELTAEHAFLIGRFLGNFYTQSGHRARILIGRDTRASGDMLDCALCAGLCASGADAYRVGVIPTPAISYLTKEQTFDCGVMISASHNPFSDNGIKLVNRDGEKMEEDVLCKIEAFLDKNEKNSLPHATGTAIGRMVDFAVGRDLYRDWLLSLFPSSLTGMRIALDCANGAAASVATGLLRTLGATVFVMGCEPDGTNINAACGSTHPQAIGAFVRACAADVGFAFDGDADRCIAADEKGNPVNGDHLLYLFATDMKSRGELMHNTVVTTTMSNLGLYRALRAAGIESVQTQVGDRYVWENMRATGNAVGGEPSGHIILSAYECTGDGLLCALHTAQIIARSGQKLSVLAAPVVMYPQVMKNVRVTDKSAVLAHPAVQESERQARLALGGSGRLVVRESGTEPVVRVMAEAESQDRCDRAVSRVVHAILASGFAASEC